VDGSERFGSDQYDHGSTIEEMISCFHIDLIHLPHISRKLVCALRCL
jgi:hypothetical protein